MTTITTPTDGEPQSEVLSALWRVDEPQTPGQVLESIDADVAYTTVMTILARLWTKGLAERVKQGRAYAYTPADVRGRPRGIADARPAQPQLRPDGDHRSLRQQPRPRRGQATPQVARGTKEVNLLAAGTGVAGTGRPRRRLVPSALPQAQAGDAAADCGDRGHHDGDRLGACPGRRGRRLRDPRCSRPAGLVSGDLPAGSTARRRSRAWWRRRPGVRSSSVRGATTEQSAGSSRYSPRSTGSRLSTSRARSRSRCPGVLVGWSSAPACSRSSTARSAAPSSRTRTPIWRSIITVTCTLPSCARQVYLSCGPLQLR